jgi:cyanophycinase
VAVITSACPDSQCGEDEYYKGDGEEMATRDFFLKLGMAPKHISVQIDNYQQATNLFTMDGYRNYIYIDMADIIYFNGGDQSRHIRCWMNDDGTPNPIFSIIKRNVNNNKAILVTVSAGTAAMGKTTFGGGSSFGHLFFANTPGLAPLQISDNHGLNDVRNGTKCLQF